MISDNQLKEVASLSMLNLSSKEEEILKKDLNDMIEFASDLSSVIEIPCERIKKAVSIEELRQDEIQKSTDTKLLFSNAKKESDGCFTVPRVVR